MSGLLVVVSVWCGGLVRGFMVSEKGSLHPSSSSFLGSGTACGVSLWRHGDSPRLFEWGLGVYKGYSRLILLVKKFLTPIYPGGRGELDSPRQWGHS